MFTIKKYHNHDLFHFWNFMMSFIIVRFLGMNIEVLIMKPMYFCNFICGHGLMLMLRLHMISNEMLMGG